VALDMAREDEETVGAFEISCDSSLHFILRELRAPSLPIQKFLNIFNKFLVEFFLFQQWQ